MRGVLGQLVLDAPHLWPLALLAVLLTVVIIARLYRPQVSSISQPWRSVLPILRTAALVALAISILKPVVVRSASPSESDAIVVVVDRSESMSARDLAYLPDVQNPSPGEQRGISYLVSLADSLGMIPSGARDPQLISLKADLAALQLARANLARAQTEANFARGSGGGNGAANARVVQATAQFNQAAQKVASHSDLFGKDGPAAQAAAGLVRRPAGSRNLPFGPGLDQEEIRTLFTWQSDRLAKSDFHLYQSDPQITAACDELAGLSRFGRVDRALTRDEFGLLSKIPPQVPLFGFTVADSAMPLPLRGQGQPVRRLLANPDGLSTDLVKGVREVVAHLAGQPMAAVVLISDGRETGDQSITPILTSVDVPIFCVYSAAPESLLRDVSVADVNLPKSCFVGESVTARARIRSSNMQGQSETVSFEVDGSPAATRPVTLASTAVTAEFPIKFDKPGVHRVAASVPVAADAPAVHNKRSESWIKVLSDRVNIGLYGGSANWDFQYVANALSRTPWISLSRGIFESPGARLNLSPEQILDLDLLILWDVPISALSDQQWKAVNKLVNDRGGSVLVVAGEEHVIQEYAANSITASLLPYSADARPVWREWPGNEAGFHVAPALGTQGLDAFRLAESGENSEQYWNNLPAFFRYLAIPSLKPAARPLLVERDFSSPLLVENRVGLGRAFFLGMNETWRWRYKVGERDQDRFWLQFLRYAADEPYASRAPQVWLDADPIAARPGQPIRIRARVVDENDDPSQEPAQTVELIQDKKVVQKITLGAVGTGGWGRYLGTLRDVPAGDYKLQLAPPDGPDAASIPLHIAPSAEAEMADLSGNREFLQRLAESSRGQLVNLDQIDSLPQMILRAQDSQNRIAQHPIWDSYYLYSFVVACFAVEWAIRKRLGLM